MQTTKQATGLRTAGKDYQTIVQQAIDKVNGYEQLYKDLQRAINVSGKSTSTLTNYGRHLAHLALHYNMLPTELDHEQVLDYLHLVKANGSPSATFFKFTPSDDIQRGEPCMACAMPASCAVCPTSSLVFLLFSDRRSCL